MTIRFRMNRICTEQFAILKDTAPSNDVTVGLTVDLKYAPQAQMMAVGAMFSFLSEDDMFMVLKVLCEFRFNPDDWNACMADNVVTIPKNTADYLLSQTVGVARGVLHSKTEGTAFNSIVLPPLNVSQIIKEDIRINT